MIAFIEFCPLGNGYFYDGAAIAIYAGISEGIRYLNGSDTSPHSPPSVGLGISPPGRSTSPGFDSSAEKPVNRKRTNTASSGGGEKKTRQISYNFNVITCESCKAFFRRNANKEREIRCPFNEQCEINVVSRRFCQRCRLAKCFDVGMKKEWIMSDEARLEKKQRVEENRERRMADAMARAETVDDDDTQNDLDVAERMRQRSSQTQELSQQYDATKSEPRLEETQPLVRPSDELYSLNPPPDHPNVPIVVPPLLEAGSTAADVSSTTTAAPTMDVDPATTMSSSGFIPPAVTKDLLAAGNNSSNTETSREEAKLESTEDFHMNGLLPSEESSVQWLNACAPTVDPSVVVDERPSGRRDSFYMNSGMVDTRINSVPAPTNLNGLSPSDHVTINEVLTANHAYKNCSDSCDQYRHDDRGFQQINFSDGCVRRFVRMLKRLPCFNLFSTYDRCILIRSKFLFPVEKGTIT
ncbi:zinc finger, C4 type [Cooperia oncophora]